MSKNTQRSKACHAFQEKMARKREREFQHDQKWNNRVHYYKQWELKNDRYEAWTSPRYYEYNNQLIETARKEREKHKSLQQRREKLKKLLAEDEATYEIELMMKKSQSLKLQPTKVDEIPTELLQDVLKVTENDRTRHETEQRLYYQWRNTNSSVHKTETSRKPKELKLSWLDHQIEKRMAKEREEKEARFRRKQREKQLEEEREKQKLIEKENRRKCEKLKEEITSLMEELHLKQKQSEQLREEENNQLKIKEKLTNLRHEMTDLNAKRQTQENSLRNVRHYKLKLREKLKNVQENIRDGREIMRKISDFDLIAHVKPQSKRDELSQTVSEYLEFSGEQRNLEKSRLEFLDSVFDSELRSMYEKQSAIWCQEESARKRLIEDVLGILIKCADDDVAEIKQKQIDVVLEREKLLAQLENREKELKQ